MTEWYTYCEWGKPVEVILGRRHAVARLLLNMRVTPEMRKDFGRYLEGRLPDLRATIGVGEKSWDNVLERSITRCIGPGSEV